MNKKRWFWLVRVFLIEKHSWTWDRVKELTIPEVSYTIDHKPSVAAAIINKDFT